MIQEEQGCHLLQVSHQIITEQPSSCQIQHHNLFVLFIISDAPCIQVLIPGMSLVPQLAAEFAVFFKYEHVGIVSVLNTVASWALDNPVNIPYEELFGGFQGDELVGGEYGVEVAVRQLGGEFYLYAFVFPHHFKWFDAVIGDNPMLLVLFVK